MPVLVAQGQSAPSGHWEGVIQLPNKQLKVTADLYQNEKREWAGRLVFPELTPNGFPITRVEIKSGTVLFDTGEMLNEFDGSSPRTGSQ